MHDEWLGYMVSFNDEDYKQIAKHLAKELRATADHLKDQLEDDSIMGTKELAEYLGVSEKWIYNHKHELHHFKVGIYLKFKRSEIDKWIEGKDLAKLPRTA